MRRQPQSLRDAHEWTFVAPAENHNRAPVDRQPHGFVVGQGTQDAGRHSPILGDMDAYYGGDLIMGELVV